MIYYNGKKYKVLFNGVNIGGTSTGSTTTTGSTTPTGSTIPTGSTTGNTVLTGYTGTLTSVSKASIGIFSANTSISVNSEAPTSSKTYSLSNYYDVSNYSKGIVNWSTSVFGQFYNEKYEPMVSESYLYFNGKKYGEKAFNFEIPKTLPLVSNTAKTGNVKYVRFNIPNEATNWKVTFLGNDYKYQPPYSISGNTTVLPTNSFTIGVWNIGHFAGGTGTVTKITEATKTAKAEKITQWLNDLGNGYMPQVMGFCEYTDYFSTDSALTKDVLLSSYTNESYGGLLGFTYNAMFSKFKLIESGKSESLVPLGCAARNYVWHKFDMNGTEVMIVTTHAPHSTCTRHEEGDDVFYNERKVFYDKMADLIRQHDHIIVMGDFNQTGPNIVRPVYLNSKGNKVYGFGWGGEDTSFASSIISAETITGKSFTGEKIVTNEMKNLGCKYLFGYDADGGYNMKYHVDNIICKGFEISNWTAINYDYVKGDVLDETISDHPGVGCTLTLIK